MDALASSFRRCQIRPSLWTPMGPVRTPVAPSPPSCPPKHVARPDRPRMRCCTRPTRPLEVAEAARGAAGKRGGAERAQSVQRGQPGSPSWGCFLSARLGLLPPSASLSSPSRRPGRVRCAWPALGPPIRPFCDGIASGVWESATTSGCAGRDASVQAPASDQLRVQDAIVQPDTPPRSVSVARGDDARRDWSEALTGTAQLLLSRS